MYPVIDENVAPVATSASMSLAVQSQISTAKPSSSIRRIRSRSSKSVNTISGQTASWNAPHATASSEMSPRRAAADHEF